MLRARRSVLLFVLLAVAPQLFGDTVLSKKRTVTKLAEGVYTIRHVDPFESFVDGNTTVVIGGREVFVVDSCSLQASAQEDIAQIKRWTDKPVRYLLNTHWHNDHNAGNKTYMDAYPGVAIIAQKETARLMEGYDRHLMVQLASEDNDASKIRATLKTSLETGKGHDGKPLTEAQKTDTIAKIAVLENIIAQYKSFIYQGPTLMFDHELNIDLGNREVQVRFFGRGNTAGDAVAYLPKENILATGDLVVSPVPFIFDGYPAEWPETLARMAQLDANIIVPGHGDVMHDKTYINLLIELFRTVVAQVREQLYKNTDATLEDVKKAIDLSALRQKFAGDDKAVGGWFLYVASNLIEFAYREAKQG